MTQQRTHQAVHATPILAPEDGPAFEVTNDLGIAGGFDGFCAYVDDLNASMSVPKSLTELGVKNPDIDALTAAALKDPSTGGNPIEMAFENTKTLFEQII